MAVIILEYIAYMHHDRNILGISCATELHKFIGCNSVLICYRITSNNKLGYIKSHTNKSSNTLLHLTQVIGRTVTGYIFSEIVFEEVVIHASLDILPIHRYVGITVLAWLLMPETNGVHQLVYDDTHVHTAGAKRYSLVSTNHTNRTEAPMKGGY